jgi:hypothetical protein
MPYVVLGAAVSIGVVALTASRFGWRRTKAEPAPEIQPTPEAEPPKEPRFKPAPPRDANAPRWDSPPAEYAKSGRGSP